MVEPNLAADLLRMSLCYSDMVLLFSLYFLSATGLSTFIFRFITVKSRILSYFLGSKFSINFKGSMGWYGLFEARFWSLGFQRPGACVEW